MASGRGSFFFAGSMRGLLCPSCVDFFPRSTCFWIFNPFPSMEMEDLLEFESKCLTGANVVENFIHRRLPASKLYKSHTSCRALSLHVKNIEDYNVEGDSLSQGNSGSYDADGGDRNGKGPFGSSLALRFTSSACGAVPNGLPPRSQLHEANPLTVQFRGAAEA